MKIRQAQPAGWRKTAELERLGLSQSRKILRSRFACAPARASPGSNRKWPSYEVPRRRATKPKHGRRNRQSIADFTWCMIAADWGWSIDEIADRLLEESAKARDNGTAMRKRPRGMPRLPLNAASSNRSGTGTDKPVSVQEGAR